MSIVKAIQWWEPRQKYFPEVVAELRQIFTPAVLIRITCYAILIVFAVAKVLPQYIPNLVVDWVAVMTRTILLGMAVIALTCVVAFIPKNISVKLRGIQIVQGERCRLLKYNELTEIRIEPANDQFYRLFLHMRSEEEMIVYGVPCRIPVEILVAELERYWGGKVKVDALASMNSPLPWGRAPRPPKEPYPL